MKKRILKIFELLLVILAFACLFMPVAKNGYKDTVYGYECVFGSGDNQSSSFGGMLLMGLIIALILLYIVRFTLEKFDTLKMNICLTIVSIVGMALFFTFSSKVMLRGNDYPKVWVDTMELTYGAILGAIALLINAVLIVSEEVLKRLNKF